MASRRGYLPGGIGEASAILSGRLATAISRYPTGRYGLVGSIPYALSVEDPRAFSPGQRKSMVWETEQEVIDALVALGITHFQLADCSWYDTEHTADPPDFGPRRLDGGLADPRCFD